MSLDMIGGAAGAWIAVALALAIAELAIPGVFLIFLAIAAAITGGAVLVLADLPTIGQIASFAIWSVVTVMIGKRWYRDYPVATSDALLNDRGARLIGQRAVVDQTIVGGDGRVRVADGSWPATGPDLPSGEVVRIEAIRDGILVVAPVDTTVSAPTPDGSSSH